MKRYIVKSYQLSVNGVWEKHVQSIEYLSDALNWITYLEYTDDTMFDSMTVVIEDEEK